MRFNWCNRQTNLLSTHAKQRLKQNWLQAWNAMSTAIAAVAAALASFVLNVSHLFVRRVPSPVVSLHIYCIYRYTDTVYLYQYTHYTVELPCASDFVDDFYSMDFLKQKDAYVFLVPAIDA